MGDGCSLTITPLAQFKVRQIKGRAFCEEVQVPSKLKDPRALQKSTYTSIYPRYGQTTPAIYMMTDSPAVHAWLDPKEQPILDAILSIRDKLSLLKQDRSTYIRSHDVLTLHDELIEQVHNLNDIRKAEHKALEQNRGGSPTAESVTAFAKTRPQLIAYSLFQWIMSLTIASNSSLSFS